MKAFKPEKPDTIVGIVGNAACGKDTVASVFEEFGFVHQSASDILREEITWQGLEPTRKLQTAMANETRRTMGAAYFVEQSIRRAMAHIRYTGRVVVSGLYAPAEGAFLTNNGGYLVAVTDEAEDLEARYGRIQERSAGSRDALTYAEFQAAHARENQGHTDDEANVARLLAMSRYVLVHGGRREQILPQVARIVEEVTNE